MQDDHFYSDYGQSTLVLQGTVARLDRRGSDVVVEFVDSSAYKVLCDLGSLTSPPAPKDVVTFVAEGATAERQSAAVLLTNCVIT